MRVGDHSRGGIELVEGKQVRAWCICGWSTRVNYRLSEGDGPGSKVFAVEEAEVALHVHKTRIEIDPDQGMRLEGENI